MYYDFCWTKNISESRGALETGNGTNEKEEVATKLAWQDNVERRSGRSLANTLRVRLNCHPNSFITFGQRQFKR